jgi:hypothetical protein
MSSLDIDKGIMWESRVMDSALKLTQTFPAEPASLDEAFVVRTSDGETERLGTYVYDLPEPLRRVYGAKLPAWIAGELDQNARSKNPTRGGTYFMDLLVVHYRPTTQHVALLDGLRWDGLNYSYMDYAKVFGDVQAELLFLDHGQETLLSVSPVDRLRMRKSR